MSRDPKATALRHAARHNGRCCYTTGRTVLLALGVRQEGERITGQVFEHEAPSAGAAATIAERIWRTWATFPHLTPQRVLEVTDEYVAAERAVAMRRMRRTA